MGVGQGIENFLEHSPLYVARRLPILSRQLSASLQVTENVEGGRREVHVCQPVVGRRRADGKFDGKRKIGEKRVGEVSAGWVR